MGELNELNHYLRTCTYTYVRTPWFNLRGVGVLFFFGGGGVGGFDEGGRSRGGLWDFGSPT